MEKSGCVLLTQEQIDRIRNGVFPDDIPATEPWGITTISDLKAIVDTGQYRIVEQN